MKQFIKLFFSSKPNKYTDLLSALSYSLLLLHILEIRTWKFSLLSIFNPNNVTQPVGVITFFMYC